MEDEFRRLLGQTSPNPFLTKISRARGSYIYSENNVAYLDMIAGVAVNNIGHNHPLVIDAIKEQIEKHLHVMVYGEFIQQVQLDFAQNLIDTLPDSLNCVYPVNSGTEANEAALKLAKRATGRTELIGFKGSYHGSTHGSMSVSSNEIKKTAFRPLLPDVRFLTFDDISELTQISNRTAAVIIEPIQGDAGVRTPSIEFMQELRRKCSETGAILIFDEIQCGMGRTGKMHAFEHFNVVPDVLTLGKALGGGMPIGALVSSGKNLKLFTHDPMLGHITTFGGHPVVCAAANACLHVLKTKIDFGEVERLGQLLESKLEQHDEIKEIRRIGLMFACDMESDQQVSQLVKKCMDKGLISFWFLSHPNSFRLSPPLNISEEDILKAAKIISASIDEIRNN